MPVDTLARSRGRCTRVTPVVASAPMPTPTELRTLATSAETEAAKLAHQMPQQIAALRAQAVELRRLADAMERAQGLPAIARKGTTGTSDMEARPASRGSRVSARNTRGGWPFQAALHKRNLSVPMWARAQKHPPISSTEAAGVEVARSWLKKPGHGGRPCPPEWAKRIEKEFVDENGASEVPAVEASWPNGIGRGARA